MVEPILPLDVNGAVVRKRGRTILGPLDLVISGQQTTVVIGPNGSGKTTLLRSLHGLERLREGKIEWAGKRDVVLAEQSFVFQTPIMLRRSVLENVVYPLKLRKTPISSAKATALEWLNRIGLAAFSDLDATSLSAGERQKLALARALVTKPQVLFLDEPTANLDGRATREIETILSESISSGLRVVMTTHDMGQAKRLADEIVFLHRGKIHESGPSDQFFKKPKTVEARSFLRGEIVE